MKHSIDVVRSVYNSCRPLRLLSGEPGQADAADTADVDSRLKSTNGLRDLCLAEVDVQIAIWYAGNLVDLTKGFAPSPHALNAVAVVHRDAADD